MHYVYTIYNKDAARIYTGETESLERRLEWHNSKKFSRSYTARFNGIWQLIYFEEVSDRKKALVREKQLKSYQGRIFLKKYIPR